MAKKHTNAPDAAPASDATSLGDKVAQLKGYFEESKGELRKVSWPTRKETWATSMAVLVFVFVMSLLLGFMDLGLTNLIKFILS